MSDVADLRRVAADVSAYYDASLPPALLDPAITSLAPATVSAAAGAITVTVHGRNYAPDSVVEVNQVAQPTTYVDSSTLTISYNPATAGTTLFTVRNSGGQESNSAAFVVAALAARGAETGEGDEQPTPSAGNGGRRRKGTT